MERFAQHKNPTQDVVFKLAKIKMRKLVESEGKSGRPRKLSKSDEKLLKIFF